VRQTVARESLKKMKFLLLTDNTTSAIGTPRYLGPYRIAHELENNGIQTFVLDKFYSFPNFFEFLENFLDEEFIGIGFSTTFFTPPDILESYDRYTLRFNRCKNYYDYGIISSDENERIKWFKKLRKVLNKKAPKAKIFVGGSKAQFFYHKMYEKLHDIDYVVMGVTDMVFPQVIKDIVEKGAPSFRTMGNKKVVDTMTKYIQPKVCPKHEWKDHWFIQKNELLPIEIGRGCAFNCKFCNYDKRDNTRKTSSDLKDEFISNYEKHGTQFYHFVDDCFNDSRNKVEEVCNVIATLPFKIEWVSYLRFDVAVKFPHTMDMIVDSGGRGFHWGVESLTHEVARRAGKGSDPEQIKEFIINFAKKNKGLCYSTGSFITGLPGETEESWRKQVDWLINTENFDFIHMGSLGIVPFKQEFDGSVIDYADYSRNPQKYGFQEIDMNTGYWKHETMDKTKATELADSSFREWEKKLEVRRGVSSDIWIYPFLRSLGLDQKEVSDIFFSTDPQRQQELVQKVRMRIKAKDENYFQQMKGLARDKKEDDSISSWRSKILEKLPF
jgi:radical SAM superfamily enzyme YgiQ (UPF0313 family)